MSENEYCWDTTDQWPQGAKGWVCTHPDCGSLQQPMAEHKKVLGHLTSHHDMGLDDARKQYVAVATDELKAKLQARD